MADEEKKPDGNPGGNPPADSPTSVSPAPAEVTDKKPDDVGDDEKPKTGGGPQPDPLSDGTVPTILATGNTHRSVSKGKASLTTIYRRADIMTTLLTFGGAIVAAGIILGVYAFVTSNENKNKAKTPVLSNKVTNLSTADLQKLNAFFGGNAAGNSAEVLTVNSASLFDGRVAVNSDLDVTGGETVNGTASDANLTVNANANLAVTSVRGQLTVEGPTTLQGATVLAGGVTVTGNVTASGNGTFGGTLAGGTINAVILNVNSTFNLATHLNTTGSQPGMSGGTIQGDDDTGALTNVSTLGTVTFHQAYSRTPIVTLTPTSPCKLTLGSYYVINTGGSGFIIENPSSSSGNCQSFNYWVAD